MTESQPKRDRNSFRSYDNQIPDSRNDDGSICMVEVAVTSEISPDDNNDQPRLGCFERWLTLWIILAMIAGTAIGALLPSIPNALESATVQSFWLPGVIMVWIMIYPMMLMHE